MIFFGFFCVVFPKETETHKQTKKQNKQTIDLDCSRTWICYWILNSLELMNALDFVDNETIDNIINFLGNECQNEDTGGFGGGPKQHSHLAASYGAVMALMTIGTPKAYDIINRKKYYQFCKNQKQKDGSWTVNHGYTIFFLRVLWQNVVFCDG